jgi:hypothetical protein
MLYFFFAWSLLRTSSKTLFMRALALSSENVHIDGPGNNRRGTAVSLLAGGGQMEAYGMPISLVRGGSG